MTFIVKLFIATSYLCCLAASKEIFNGRFLGGNEASETQYPYQVYVKSERNYNKELCGGALIRDGRWVLTSAVCVYGYE